MVQKNKVILTQEGLKALKKEHQGLQTVKRPKTLKRMVAARDMGDLTENSEYAAARQDLAFIDRRIAELEEIFKKAQVVKSSAKGNDKVAIGSKVILKNNNEKVVFTIVGDWEADPLKNKISFSSPLGKALLGKKKGNKVDVQAPAGKAIYQILEIK